MSRISPEQMVRMMKPACGDCQSFQREDGEDWGHCKAGLPQTQMMLDEEMIPYQITFWPQVDLAEGACGQWNAGT